MFTLIKILDTKHGDEKKHKIGKLMMNNLGFVKLNTIVIIM
jgi:hypothetical protein